MLMTKMIYLNSMSDM